MQRAFYSIGHLIADQECYLAGPTGYFAVTANYGVYTTATATVTVLNIINRVLDIVTPLMKHSAISSRIFSYSGVYFQILEQPCAVKWLRSS